MARLIRCDRCTYNTPISGCVHEEGWRHYYEEDAVTECEWFEEEEEDAKE